MSYLFIKKTLLKFAFFKRNKMELKNGDRKKLIDEYTKKTENYFKILIENFTPEEIKKIYNSLEIEISDETINKMLRLKEEKITVINLNWTSYKRCHCGSWIKHWREYSGQTANRCRAVGCSSYDIVGAHVKKYKSVDNNTYIVPLCKFHNASSEPIEINIGTKLVSANISKTCGK